MNIKHLSWKMAALPGRHSMYILSHTVCRLMASHSYTHSVFVPQKSLNTSSILLNITSDCTRETGECKQLIQFDKLMNIVVFVKR